VMCYNTKKMGIVIAKKMQLDSPYAAPVDAHPMTGEHMRERLKYLCYWTTGEHQWVDAAMVMALESKDV